MKIKYILCILPHKSMQVADDNETHKNTGMHVNLVIISMIQTHQGLSDLATYTCLATKHVFIATYIVICIDQHDSPHELCTYLGQVITI